MRYLDITPTHTDEAGYTIEEGVVIDSDSRPTARKAYDEWTRHWQPSQEDRKAEEATWAAKSGPCVIIRPATAERKAS